MITNLTMPSSETAAFGNNTCPVALDVLNSTIENCFEFSKTAEDSTPVSLNVCISDLLTRISQRPECVSYKFIVTATQVQSGPAESYVGAYWDDNLDGIHVRILENEDRTVIVNIAWIHL